ncbi:MAG: glycosyltransferase family 2 protein [Myxococcales bacterium]|jgi:dolichol-phosphate mannosyltransferase|nr:glycosyltransferase family 2 protein [Myxococcales bacterium]MBL0194391.1 glycosyltransferase family 2 protein [Myxococcales bacterium]HQY62052.1 glycosyltransferase family 2 protein [Polyangiaceae bacterium]
MKRPTLSLVLPIFNEAEVLPELRARLTEFMGQLPADTEVIFVDDGSKDDSLRLLRDMARAQPRYKVLSFARNFGHQVAITAGIDYARGEAVVVMDADLQDPPEVVAEMVAKWREGYDVVYGKRRSRAGETWFKLLTARWFYRLFAAMIPIEVPLDTGDFRLMSRRVVVALRELREVHRFVRGMVSWVGFKQTAVLYDRAGRFAGETKYPLRKMLKFAADGITSFSVLPLRLATYAGAIIAVGAVGVAAWAVLAKFVFDATVPGWTAVTVLVSLLAAVQLLMIGILGEYVGRIYEQVKARPLYVLRETQNMPLSPDTSELDVASSMYPPATRVVTDDTADGEDHTYLGEQSVESIDDPEPSKARVVTDANADAEAKTVMGVPAPAGLADLAKKNR